MTKAERDELFASLNSPFSVPDDLVPAGSEASDEEIAALGENYEQLTLREKVRVINAAISKIPGSEELRQKLIKQIAGRSDQKS
jgi:hypothetical protein